MNAENTPPADDVREALRGEPLALSLFRMFVREHDEGDGPERVLVEVADIRTALRLLDARPRGTVTSAPEVDALIAETRAFLAERPMGPPIFHRIGKLVAALEAAREVHP